MGKFNLDQVKHGRRPGVRGLNDSYLDRIRGVDPLTNDELADLSRRSRRGDTEARDRMFLSCARWVVRIAKRFRGRGVDFDDLVQAGNIGLLRAIERYNPKRAKLITYASYWIVQAMQREVSQHSRTIRVPHRKQYVDRVSDDGRVEIVNIIRHGTVSLDEIEEACGNSPAIARTKGPSAEAEERELTSYVWNAIKRLPPRVRMVIRARLRGVALSVVGDRVGISKERIRQLEAEGRYLLCRMIERRRVQYLQVG